MTSIHAFLDFVAHACIVVSAVLLVFMVLAFGWLVFGRYVLNDTPTWIGQTSLLIVAYVTCLGAAAGVRTHDHLAIDFVREAMPRWPREFLRYLSDLFVMVFGGFMAWQGGLMVLDNLHRNIPIIDLSESWRAAPLVICGVLMVLFSVCNAAERILFPEREQD